ncbi:MAG TPA: hypothetical protein PLE30_06625 [Candidatus Kapabacteria bacterium]|nr:hypothetical protein [Candidatus Kapabacteria bacterium]
MSKIILVDDIEPGAILAQSVTNSLGQVLIGKGAELDYKTIKVLKTWNIKSVSIIDGSESMQNEINPELLEIAKQRVKARITWEPRNSNEKDLFNTIVEITAQELHKTQV